MSNYIKDTLKDVIRHTHDLGILEMVKIKGINRTQRLKLLMLTKLLY